MTETQIRPMRVPNLKYIGLNVDTLMLWGLLSRLIVNRLSFSINGPANGLINVLGRFNCWHNLAAYFIKNR